MKCDNCKEEAPLKYIKKVTISMFVEDNGSSQVHYHFCMFCLNKRKVQITNEVKLIKDNNL